MMMEYEMAQAEGKSKGLLKWYRRQMKKQVRTPPSQQTMPKILNKGMSIRSTHASIAILLRGGGCRSCAPRLIARRRAACWPSATVPTMWP